MRIKRYEGQYVHEVIGRIKEELGHDAVVLHTRWRNPAGLKKLLGKPQVEVWAGARDELGAPGDEAAPPPSEALAAAGVPGGLDLLDSATPALPDSTDELPAASAPEPAAAAALREVPAVELDHDQLAAAIAASLGGASLADPVAPQRPAAGSGPVAVEARPRPVVAPAPTNGTPRPPAPSPAPAADDLTVAMLAQFSEAMERLEEKFDALQARVEPEAAESDSPRLRALVESGVDPEVAREIAAAAEGRSVAEVLLETFQGTPALDWSDGPRVIAVVGPSGVGKTTTIAKLAGHYALTRGARVMLASSDTQRIGAFEQIKALGQLMELPTAALRQPGEVQARLQLARQAHDVILVDTAACTPQDGAAWERLLETLIAVEPDEILVAVSATMRTREVVRVVEYFRQVLPLAGAVVTKLDEAVEAGLLVDLAWRCMLPIAWLGEGQEVPGDLTQARPDDLLARVWSPRLGGPAEE